MLQIREQHMNALAVQQTSGFTDRMISHLREVFAVEVEDLDEAGLRVFIEKVWVQAEEWDITEEQHVERLLELYVCFAELRLDPLPEWVSRIARDSNRTADEVVSAIEDRLRFGDPIS